MLYTLDCEFIEDGITIDLISLALVAEDGREFYVQNASCRFERANPWVKEHVLPHLTCFSLSLASPMLHPENAPHVDCPWLSYSEIGDATKGFIAYDTTPEFWGYYCAYDWVALCQCFGAMVALPHGWPMYCRDLRQALDKEGYTDVTQPDDMPHHALSDARWIMRAVKSYA